MLPSEEAWIIVRYVAGEKQADIASDIEVSSGRICMVIKKFCNEWSGVNVEYGRHYGKARRQCALKALENYYMNTDGVIERPRPVWRSTAGFSTHDYSLRIYSQGRHEHAWLLRAEGQTLKCIGDRLGVGRQRASQMIRWQGERVARAIKRMKMSIEVT